MLPFFISIHGQNLSFSGFVNDSASGDPLVGAYVFDSISMRGCSSNGYGYFSLTLDSLSTQLRISYVGYETKTFELDRTEFEPVNYNLSSHNTFDEVLIFGSQPIQKASGSSEINIPLSMVKQMPSFLGEPDLYKTILLLPGVQSGIEGAAGLHVRGGSSDHNLILLDEVPLYNVNHLMGFFSVFNMDAIRSASFIKGGIPARYGGRLASVLDVKMKEGNTDEFSGVASIGLLSSQFMLEGPIKKSEFGYMVAARRTYSDLIYRPILSGTSGVNAGYHFYDINGSLSYKVNKRNGLFYSLFYGNDKGYVKENNSAIKSEEISLKWGNTAHSFRWNHVYNSNTFSNLTAAYSGYKYLFGRTSNELINNSNELLSENSYSAYIRDVILKYDIEQVLGTNQRLQYGISGNYHFYKPGISSVYSKVKEVDSVILARGVEALELHGYFEDRIELFGKLAVNAGIHLSSFHVDDTAYYSIEPRLSAVLNIGKRGALMGSYSWLTQYVSLLTSAYLGLPTDLWIPTTKKIPPQKSHLFVLGYHQTSRWFNFSIEAYYKTMNGLIEYKQGASYKLGRESWEELVAFGTGEAYGLEFLVEKDFGRISGWISYTLSKNTRHFPDIDDSFPYKYDRRHNFSVSGLYKISKKISLSVIWMFYSGENVTFSNARYLTYPGIATDYKFNSSTFPGLMTVESFSDRNNFQLEPYHRLDVGFSFNKQKKRGERVWRLGVYNLYNRQNTSYILVLENDEGYLNLNKYSFTPVMPYFRYEFRF